MKKRLALFILVSFLLSGSIRSQGFFNGSQLSLSIGPSLPIGKFADKDLYNTKSGVASIGAAATISYIHKTKSKISLMASLIGQINPIDRHSIEKSFSSVKISFSGGVFWSGSGTPPITSNGTNYTNWKFEKASWKLRGVLAGGYKELGTGWTTISITTKLQAGLVYVSSPGLYGRSITDTTDIQVRQTRVSAFGFGYALNAGIKIKPAKKTFMLVGLDFFGTNNITFKNVRSSISGVKNNSNGNMVAFNSSATSNGSQTMNSLNAFVGIGIRL